MLSQLKADGFAVPSPLSAESFGSGFDSGDRSRRRRRMLEAAEELSASRSDMLVDESINSLDSDREDEDEDSSVDEGDTVREETLRDYLELGDKG